MNDKDILDFKSYPSLINHYQTKEIDKWLEKFPELKDEKYIVQEKIDGANFQILITKDKVLYGNRTRYLDDDFKFYNWKEAIAHVKTLINMFQLELKTTAFKSIRLFGELYGSNLNKRISYQKDQRIRFYDAMVDDRLIPYKTFLGLTKHFSQRLSTHIILPELMSLEEALAFDVENTYTKYNEPNYDPYKNLYVEGIVIKPVNKIYSLRGHDIFYIKKKSERFSDKIIRKSRPKKPEVDIPENIQKLICEYQKYLTKNRILDTFSKYGALDDIKNLKQYIKYVMDDAISSFEKDFDKEISHLNKKELKQVYSSTSSIIVPMLKEEL